MIGYEQLAGALEDASKSGDPDNYEQIKEKFELVGINFEEAIKFITDRTRHYEDQFGKSPQPEIIFMLGAVEFLILGVLSGRENNPNDFTVEDFLGGTE